MKAISEGAARGMSKDRRIILFENFCRTWCVDRLFDGDPVRKVFAQLVRVARQDDVVGLVAGREGKAGRLGLLLVE